MSLLISIVRVIFLLALKSFALFVIWPTLSVVFPFLQLISAPNNFQFFQIMAFFSVSSILWYWLTPFFRLGQDDEHKYDLPKATFQTVCACFIFPLILGTIDYFLFPVLQTMPSLTVNHMITSEPVDFSTWYKIWVAFSFANFPKFMTLFKKEAGE